MVANRIININMYAHFENAAAEQRDDGNLLEMTNHHYCKSLYFRILFLTILTEVFCVRVVSLKTNLESISLTFSAIFLFLTWQKDDHSQRTIAT